MNNMPRVRGDYPGMLKPAAKGNSQNVAGVGVCASLDVKDEWLKLEVYEGR